MCHWVKFLAILYRMSNKLTFVIEVKLFGFFQLPVFWILQPEMR